MSKYKYLLWDIDGTILDFESAEKAAIKTLFERFNLGECSDEMIERYSKINRKYWQMLERGEMSKEKILVERFVEFFSKEGMDAGISDSFNREYQLALGDTIVFCDDAMDIIKEQKKKFEIVLVTNGTAVAQKKKLEKSGLQNIVNHIFISEIVGYEKPDINFFKKVISEVGINDLSEVLIIGDSLTSDIQGGYNAGIDTCWYNPKGIKNESSLSPTYIIQNLHDLDSIVN